jgi:hypothetical protein
MNCFEAFVIGRRVRHGLARILGAIYRCHDLVAVGVTKPGSGDQDDDPVAGKPRGRCGYRWAQ